jgi:hypothetical protein
MTYRDRFFPTISSFTINHLICRHNALGSILSSCDISHFIFLHRNLHSSSHPSWVPYLEPIFPFGSHATITCRPRIPPVEPTWLDIEPHFSLFIHVMALSWGGYCIFMACYGLLWILFSCNATYCCVFFFLYLAYRHCSNTWTQANWIFVTSV